VGSAQSGRDSPEAVGGEMPWAEIANVRKRAVMILWDFIGYYFALSK
jgi:hypothetical protein